MKKLFLLALIALSAITISSCKKSTSNPGVSPGKSQWTLNGTTYNGTNTIINVDTLGSADAAMNGVVIIFGSVPTTGTYTVMNIVKAVGMTGNMFGIPTLTAMQCYVIVTANSETQVFGSLGIGGNSISVTSSGGKVTAGFSNVHVQQIGGTGMNTTVSGSLIQQ